MRSSFKQHGLIGVALIAAGAAGYYGLRTTSEPAAQQPRTSAQIVRTAVAAQKSIPVTLSSNGYVTAINTVDVRPQEQNIVRSVHVREGQQVRAGQLLFTLDDRSDRSSVAQAQAEMAASRAELAEAERALKRNQELRAKGFVSQAVVDSARSKVQSLRGSLQASRAATKSTSIALSNNRITASIDGRLGAISVHPGSLAQPSGTPMVTISQLHPIAVSFSIPERELAHIVATYPNGNAPVIAQLPGAQEREGKLVFIDNAADPQSGTIRMKAQFDNEDRRLWPGSYVNVRLVSRTFPDAVVVPAQAVVTGPTEKFVYAVQPDNTVKAAPVEVVTIDEGLAALSGIAAGTRVVVEGAQNLRPGSKVKEAETATVDGTQAGGTP